MGPFEPQVWQVLHSTVNILHVPTPIQAFMNHGQSFSELPGNHNDDGALAKHHLLSSKGIRS